MGAARQPFSYRHHTKLGGEIVQTIAKKSQIVAGMPGKTATSAILVPTHLGFDGALPYHYLA